MAAGAGGPGGRTVARIKRAPRMRRCHLRKASGVIAVGRAACVQAKPVAAALASLLPISKSPHCPLLPSLPLLLMILRTCLPSRERSFPFPPDLVQWYMGRVAIGPHLRATTMHTNVSLGASLATPGYCTEVPNHCTAPYCGGSSWHSYPTSATADALRAAGWQADLVVQIPREVYQPHIGRNSFPPYASAMCRHLPLIHHC